MRRVVQWESVDSCVSEGLQHTIRSRRANAVIIFGAPKGHLGYQVWMDGEPIGFAATESAAIELFNRRAGSGEWTHKGNWDD